MKYKIIDLQGYPLPSWKGLHTKKSLLETFAGYAADDPSIEVDIDTMTLRDIEGTWGVALVKVKKVKTVEGNVVKEYSHKNEDLLRKVRRDLINKGRSVSLMGYDPRRDLYGFDLLS